MLFTRIRYRRNPKRKRKKPEEPTEKSFLPLLCINDDMNKPVWNDGATSCCAKFFAQGGKRRTARTRAGTFQLILGKARAFFKFRGHQIGMTSRGIKNYIHRRTLEDYEFCCLLLGSAMVWNITRPMIVDCCLDLCSILLSNCTNKVQC